MPRVARFPAGGGVVALPRTALGAAGWTALRPGAGAPTLGCGPGRPGNARRGSTLGACVCLMAWMTPAPSRAAGSCLTASMTACGSWAAASCAAGSDKAAMSTAGISAARRQRRLVIGRVERNVDPTSMVHRKGAEPKPSHHGRQARPLRACPAPKGDPGLWIALPDIPGREVSSASSCSFEDIISFTTLAVTLLTSAQRTPTVRIVSRLDGRSGKGRKAAGEESPGSMETRCRVTPGGGDPRESATESKPPVCVAYLDG